MIKYREKLNNSYILYRSYIFQRLYKNITLSRGDDPLSLLDVNNTPTDSTFPLMICLFLLRDFYNYTPELSAICKYTQVQFEIMEFFEDSVHSPNATGL